MQPLKMLRHPTVWGAGALTVATVLSLVVAWLYITPPGQKTVTFYTKDAASVHSGDQVRIAGVPVGKIADLALEPNQVRVRARVDGSAFIGDQSQIEVRMLTVVGGYYVDVVSLGDAPLGARPIPVERVTMPYNLIQTLADSTKISNEVNPTPLKDSLDQLEHGLSGDNTHSLSAIIDAGNSIMSTIEKQRGQVTQILNFSDEYIQALNGFQDELKDMVRKTSIALQSLVLYGDNFANGLAAFCQVLNEVAPLSYFYVNHRDKFLEKVRDYLERARMWAEQNGVVIRAVREVRNKIERVLGAQGAPPELLATDMCIPVAGSPC